MHHFVIELDDRALAFAREGRVLSIAPSAVWDGSTGQPGGSNAWGGLRKHPTATSTEHLGELLGRRPPGDRSVALVAAEWVRRFADEAPEPQERVWFVVPARASQEGLRTVLAIARHLSLPVDGLVDSAVATVAALGLQRSALVFELGLHHMAATYVDHDGGQVRRRRTALSECGGLMSFYQGWLELVSTTMVKQTRFDPLHDAVTEQRLFDSLGVWAYEASAHASTTAVLTKGAERFEVVLTRDQFAQAGKFMHREALRLLHALRPAGAPLALVLPTAAAALPGFRGELEQLAGCELITIPDGFAAAMTSRLDLPPRTAGEAVRLLRRMPLVPAANARMEDEFSGVANVTRDALGSAAGREGPPTHLLLEGVVYSIGGPPLVLGRSPAGARTVSLPDGLAGVSRRHCTLVGEGGEVVLVDHSTFGTFVNGERVAERVRLRTGDRIRVGEPGVELSLISVS